MSRVQQSVSFFVLNANNPRSAFLDAAVRRGNVTSAARFIDLGLSQIRRALFMRVAFESRTVAFD